MSRISVKQVWQAQLERTDSTLIANTWSSEAHSCRQEVYDFHDLYEWVKKAIASTSAQFRVARLNGLDEFKPTAQGEQLFRLIPVMVPLIRQWPRDVTFHPNIDLLAEVMRSRHPAIWEDLYQHGRYQQPRLAADLLNGLIDHLRHDGCSAAFRSKLKRHERVIEKTFDDLKTYFRELAHAHPFARVIRIELMPNIPIKNWRVNDTYVRSYELVTAWIKHLKSSFGSALPGWAFKFDQCVPRTGSNLLCHLVLLVDNMSAPEFTSFVTVARSAWRDMTEGQGQIVDCNNGDRDWQFRSSQDHLSMLDQLHAAAVYMATTDDLIRLNTNGDPASIVMGPRPTKTKRGVKAGRLPAFPSRLTFSASEVASANSMTSTPTRRTHDPLALSDPITSRPRI
jgi:hypothetical protein